MMSRFALLLAASLPFLASTARASETIEYTYDSRGRLVQVAHTGTVNTGVITAYDLDKADNRLGRTTSGASGSSALAEPSEPITAESAPLGADDPTVEASEPSLAVSAPE